PVPVQFHPVEEPGEARGAAPAEGDVAELRRTMSADVGVVRDAAGLRRALAVIERLTARNRSPRFANMLDTARLIAIAALARTESRGGHYRSDYPEPNPAWKHRTFITLADARFLEEMAMPERAAAGA
nr:L-aspartate oxidase [Bauldia sp.]